MTETNPRNGARLAGHKKLDEMTANVSLLIPVTISKDNIGSQSKQALNVGNMQRLFISRQ